MSKKLIYLVCFVLVLSIAGNASADLVARWRFDENSGDVAHDTSGNGHDGTINGGANWVPGVGGSALEFDGTDDYVGTGESLLTNMSEFTVAFWVSAGNPDAGRIGLVGQNDVVEFGFQGSDIHIYTAGGGKPVRRGPMKTLRGIT